MILSFESVACMKQTALPSAYGPHPSLKSHVKQKGRGGKNSPLCLTAQARMLVFFCSDWDLHHKLLQFSHLPA